MGWDRCKALCLVSLVWLFCGLSHAESLQDLEKIVSEAKTLNEFLDNPGLRERYREAYKKFMGYNDDFNGGYELILNQLRDANDNFSEFGERTWALDEKWETTVVEVSAATVSSGLQFKTGGHAKLLGEVSTDLQIAAGAMWGAGKDAIQNELADLEAAYIQAVPRHSPEEVAALGDLERRQYENAVSRKTTEFLRNRDISSRLNALSAILSHSLFNLPLLRTKLKSPVTSAILAELTKLCSPGKSAELIRSELGFHASDIFLNLLKTRLPVVATFQKEFATGVKSRESFRGIPNQRLGQTAIAELHAIREADANATEAVILERMSPVARDEYRAWEEGQKVVKEKRLAEFHKFSDASSYLTYGFREDASRKALRLEAGGSGGIRLVKTPRPFHAFFTGLKRGECSWAQPRRFAVSGFAGSNAFFTFAIDHKNAEGLVKILTLDAGEGRGQYLLESNSILIAESVVVQGDSGLAKQMPIFPRVASALSQYYAGIGVSNGENIEAHTNSKKGGLYASSVYRNGHKYQLDKKLTLLDPLAARFAEHFQNDGHYAGAYLMFDGSFDGDSFVVLNFDTRMSLAEVEQEILQARVISLEYDAAHARQLAIENGFDPSEVEPFVHRVLGSDEPTRKMIGDVTNGSPGTDEAAAALVHYRNALELYPQEPALLSTRLLEGVEQNAVLNAKRDHASYEAALLAMDAALRANEAEVTKYDIPHWNELIAQRRTCAGLVARPN